MIDNARHPDARRGPLYQSAALYSISPATADATRPVGEFNHSRLTMRGNHIEHWLNGQKIVDVTLTEDLFEHTLGKRWGAASETYKLIAQQPNKNCPISLQNHGDAAWFRDIKIRKL